MTSVVFQGMIKVMRNRSPIPKLIVVKLGTSTLTHGSKELSRRHMLEIVRQVAHLRDMGHRVVVVSSGAIAAGRQVLNYPDVGHTLAGKQMLATVGQGRLMHIYQELFDLFGLHVGQVLLTRGDLSNHTGYLNARDTLLTMLAYGLIPIINENDVIATDEIRVGDNDNLSALVAGLVDAEMLILLTDQLGLYTADPRQHPNAQLVSVITNVDEQTLALAGGTTTGLGTGGMVTKLQAARIAGQHGTTTIIASGDVTDVLPRLIAGEAIGTKILPTATLRESRKRRLMGAKPQGTLTVDMGAAHKLNSGGASLLPVGITAVAGNFERGSYVRLVDPQGKLLAVGMVNYSSDEIQHLLGARSSEIVARLGYIYADEVIHRDNMVLL